MKQPLTVDEVIERSAFDADPEAVLLRIDRVALWPMRIAIGGAIVWILRALVVAYFHGVLLP